MKKIVNRKDCKDLTISEAKVLCHRLKIETDTVYYEHKSVYGYPTPEQAKRANLCSVLDHYEGYTFAFIGTVYDTFQGYKVFVVAIKSLPTDFEKLYPDYVVIG